MIPTELSKLSYDQRLAELGLTNLKDRKVRKYLIQMYKNQEGIRSFRMGKTFKHKNKDYQYII